MPKKLTAEPESSSLALTLRPKGFRSVIGQERIVKTLQSLQTKHRFPQAILFQGNSGCGKTSLARIIAISLQCEHQEEWGNPCQECRQKWEDFSIHELNASEVSGVDDLRKIAEVSRFKPQPPSKFRVIILDEAHRMSADAMNLLLKPVEEPPKTTVWIICTTTPAKLLPTLRNRCTSFELRGLTSEGVSTLLKRAAKSYGEAPKGLKGLQDGLEEAGVSAPRVILTAFEKYAMGSSVKEAVGGAEAEKIDTYRLCKAVTSGDWNAVRSQLRDATPEDCRYIRASVVGWLRGTLLREERPARRQQISASVLALTAMAPLEDGLLYSWICATLYECCRRLR